VNLVMSLDNAIAVAGVSRSDPVSIGLGLLVSALIMLAFSAIILQLIGRLRWVAYAGAGLLALTAAGMMWQDLGMVVSFPHVPAASVGLGVVATHGARWAFKALVVSTCLSSPRWWPASAAVGDIFPGGISESRG
jgi:predicted tellurium resistance membrane protein TerC